MEFSEYRHIVCASHGMTADCGSCLCRSAGYEFRPDHRVFITYFERRMLLDEVREKAKQEGHAGREWAKIACSLERVFRKSLLINGATQA